MSALRHRIVGFLVMGFLGVMGMGGGCTYDVVDPSEAGQPCDSTAITYATGVRPIMERACAFTGCHDAQTRAGGYDLSTYQGVKRAHMMGRLMGSVRHEPGYSPMPKGLPKLDSCEIYTLELWIQHGMIP